MTPDEFKAYNSNLTLELKRLANSKDKETRNMGLKLFKRSKVENSLDIEKGVVVELNSSRKKKSHHSAIVNDRDPAYSQHERLRGEHGEGRREKAR